VGAFQTCSRSAPALSTQKLFENYDPTPEDYPFSGRVRPPVVDMNLPIRWLEECLINHGPGCGHLRTIEPREPVPKLRFIDVKSKKLTEFFNINISKLKYIALSYVWGRSKYTMLTTKTLFELQTSNFGGSASLPQTIQDAIAVTERLGYQNLWVDSLCIVQDDEDDKDLQIGQMSMIYSQAVLTIVAAAGDSADAGLPGISSVRTSEQIEVALPETNIHPNRSILSTFSGRSQDNVYVASYQDTTWGSRGWTYQEHVLSARLLIFMEQQILWECGTCSWYEESHCETDIASIAWLADSYVSRTKPSKWQGFSNVWNTVSLEVVNYQRRRLTYESDASDAIDGFLNQIEKITGEAFIWGMPVSIFHSSVAYWPMMSGAPVRRACLTTRKVTALKQNVPFPSWSWLGWADLYSDIVYDSDDYCQPGM
jgi:hypothetical protein